MTGNRSSTILDLAYCQECVRLLDAFGQAVRELLWLHEQQFNAIVEGDTDCNRFDLLIHMALEKKQQVKYEYLHHVDHHGCPIHHDTDTSRERKDH